MTHKKVCCIDVWSLFDELHLKLDRLTGEFSKTPGMVAVFKLGWLCASNQLCDLFSDLEDSLPEPTEEENG